jgi:polyisoprenoid-binding protein YceI
MKKMLAAAALALPLISFAAQETYQLDPHHTFAHFSVNHLDFSTMWGRFDKSSGSVSVDFAAKKGSLELNVETASLSTGDNEKDGRPRARDEHLRSADFFNVAEFPRMTFKATNFKFAGDALTEVDGQLTLLGVTKPLALKVERFRCGPHPYSKAPMCGGNASGALKRSDFGMKFGLPAIGDEIRLYVEFEAYKK